jgi:Putative Flp pilus-assembly TadE/G-like
MHETRGQALVVAVLALVMLLGMTGLIIDGGAVFAQQRIAQNGADGAANAGAIVLAQWSTDQSGPMQDAQVDAAVQDIASRNELIGATAVYTDNVGDPIPGAAVGGGSIPSGARGVRVVGNRDADATFSRVLGVDSLTATAEATAIIGPLAGCPADTPCGLLPVTFPVQISTCTEPHETWFPPNNPFGTGGNTWPLVPIDDANIIDSPNLLATIALCTTDSGGVGWLDLHPSIPTISEEISTPFTGTLDLPDWYQTKEGNMNNVESAIDAYIGKIVLIPMWDSICRNYPGSPTTPCPPVTGPSDEPGGANIWYHIPQFANFKLYDSYIQGNDVGPCGSAPGLPQLVGGSGFAGCIKGWFTSYITEGPVDLSGDITPGESIGIQLIK